MKASEAQVIIDAVKSLVESNGASRETIAQTPSGATLVKPGSPIVTGSIDRASFNDAPGYKAPSGDDFERLYLRIKNRLIDECRVDPVLLQLLTQRPEIVIDVEPRIISMDGKSLKGRLASLIGAGWFDEAKKQGTTRSELARTGSDVNSGNLSAAFAEFVREGYLTREGDGYQRAPGLKVTERDVVAR